MQKKFSYILLALLVLGGFSCNGKNASASVIYFQPATSTLTSTTTTALYRSQPFAIGFASSSASLPQTVWFTQTTGGQILYGLFLTSITNAQIIADGFNNLSYSTCQSVERTTGSSTSPQHPTPLSEGIGGVGACSFTSTDSYTYVIMIEGGGGTTAFKGNSTPLPYAYVASDSNPPPSGTIGNRWIDPYVPFTGSYGTSSPTFFSANYFYDCLAAYDSVQFQFNDLTDSSQNFFTPRVAINACGQSTLTANVFASSTHQYLWRPLMYSTGSSTSPLYGNWYRFLATSTPNFTPFSPYLQSTVGTSTIASSTDFLSFLNVPALLQTKAPFAYIFQISDGFFSGLNSSSTNSIPSGNFIWHNTVGGTSTIDFFSQSTIETYLSPTIVLVWRQFLLFIMTIEFGMALYRKTLGHKII